MLADVMLGILLSLLPPAGGLAAAAPAGDPSVVQTRLGPCSANNPDGILASRDGIHCIWWTTVAGGKAIFFDGQPQPPFDDIGRAGLTASGRFAYSAKKDQRWTLVVDGKPGPWYDDIDDVAYGYFSPDGGHVVYAAATGRKWSLVRDGTPGPAYDQVRDDHGPVRMALFSPDGRRLALSLDVKDGCTAFIEGQPPQKYHQTRLEIVITPVFSPDGNHLAFAASQGIGDKEFIVYDGRPLTPFPSARTPVFSPDGRHLAYPAEPHDWCVVLDGRPGPQFREVDRLTFSPDGARLAYVAETWSEARGKGHLVVVDGTPGPEHPFVQPPVFSPDSKKVAYTASDGSTWSVVVDGKPGPSHKGRKKGTPVFSPDSRRLAYGGSDGAKRFLVLDGQPGAQFDLLVDESVKFSPDSRHIAYVAWTGQSQSVVLDTTPGPPFDFIVPHGPTFRPDGSVEYLGVKDGSLFRVKVSTPK